MVTDTRKDVFPGPITYKKRGMDRKNGLHPRFLFYLYLLLHFVFNKKAHQKPATFTGRRSFYCLLLFFEPIVRFKVHRKYRFRFRWSYFIFNCVYGLSDLVPFLFKMSKQFIRFTYHKMLCSCISIFK
jgi:hypothetical protein